MLARLLVRLGCLVVLIALLGGCMPHGMRISRVVQSVVVLWKEVRLERGQELELPGTGLQSIE